MKENPKVQVVVESAFWAAADRLVKGDGASVTSCLFVQLDAEAGEVQIFDERERLLKKKVIFDWADAKNKDASFTKKKIAMIRSAVVKAASEGAFGHANFAQPFAVRLTDENFQVLEVLYAVGDTVASDEGPLLKNLDRELDDFYKKLFSNVE